MLLEGQVNGVSILQWNRDRGFHVDSIDGNDFRDRWGLIHARQMHQSFYDPEQLGLSRTGIEYLLPIFTNAIGHDDVETCGKAVQPRQPDPAYHSVNIDINKRICYLDS